MQKKIVLACTQCLSRNYQTNKNTQKSDRLEVRKFCKRCNEHALHRETK
ncbi:large subunit ribosomal protein L33 [Natronobacillus azotifigens]|uniref:Large ribosomal subunit protein bL33 n=1 Tax=Natronobacillus azotifigens TaxID=472978 RepID=A0A9J6RDC8_9BACI|nr:50S ribosomal protein L33 [Natronobacillus azotifigens]MCZ0703493.1 50S ribosomal protein L33 [Natronobacillus azotifigens]